jgi:hypothetical protein
MTQRPGDAATAAGGMVWPPGAQPGSGPRDRACRTMSSRLPPGCTHLRHGVPFRCRPTSVPPVDVRLGLMASTAGDGAVSSRQNSRPLAVVLFERAPAPFQRLAIVAQLLPVARLGRILATNDAFGLTGESCGLNRCAQCKTNGAPDAALVLPRDRHRFELGIFP